MSLLNKQAALQLKAARERTCTQPQLAALLHTSATTICNIENNKRLISLQTWVEWNRAMNQCPIQQLTKLLANN